jgi:mRNA interferase RelE/StbE
VTYSITWKPPTHDQVAKLAQSFPEAPALITTAGYELEDNPRPANSVAMGTSGIRRLLLGFYRITYEIFEAEARIDILSVGRSDIPR